MRKLVLGTLLTGLMLAGSGCIFTSDDDDDGVSDGSDGSDGGDDGGDGPCGASFVGILYQPTWECPPEADTITFTTFPDGSSTSLDPFTVNCDDLQPADICYDPGIYDIEVTPDGPVDGVFASQFDTIDGVDGDLFEPDFAFSQDGGFLDVSWTINGEDPATACVKGDTIEIVATLADDPGKPFIDDAIPCLDGSAIVPPDLDGWPVGEYTVDVVLVDAGGTAISEPFPLTDVFITFEGELSPDVGTVDLITKL